MRKDECPCYLDNGDCNRRHINCHGNCPEYLAWRGRLDAYNKIYRDQSISEYINYFIKTTSKRRRISNAKKRSN